MTLYSHPDVRLVPNPANKYSVSERTGIIPDEDGGFTIYLAATAPTNVPPANWLPSTGPSQRYSMVLRMYLPKAEVLDGSWTPPPLVVNTHRGHRFVDRDQIVENPGS